MLMSAVAVHKCVALGACFRSCFACLFTRVDDQTLVKTEFMGEYGTSRRRTCQRLVLGLLVLLLGLPVCLLVLLAGLSKRFNGSRWQQKRDPRLGSARIPPDESLNLRKGASGQYPPRPRLSDAR